MKAVTMIVALSVLAGCAGKMERRASSSALPDFLDAEEMASQRGYRTFEEPRVGSVHTGDQLASTLPPCSLESTSYRVRDLRVPWAQRRYLMADGTLCFPYATAAR